MTVSEANYDTSATVNNFFMIIRNKSVIFVWTANKERTQTN